MSERADSFERHRQLGTPRLRQILPAITAGLVAGIIDIPIEISCATLIFSGVLASHVASGIGLALFGIIVIGLVIALTSSYRGMVGLPQESPAALLALVAAAIAGGMPSSATPEATFVTVVAAIGVTSLLTGVFFLVLGWGKLGSLIRYIPYPVVGGFLAGTGWLLFSGALGLLGDAPFSFAQLPALFKADALLQWLPALIFALLLLLMLRRHSHFLIVPAMLLGAIALFYAVLWLTGTSLAGASARGWLLGPFPQGALWQPLTPAALRQVHWPVIAGQAGSIGTILLVSAVSLLLNTSALELAVRQDLELNRELRSAGLANLLAGIGCGLPGFQTLGQSALSYHLGANSRLVGLTTAALCGLVLFAGARALSYFPKMVLAGLLLYLGLVFLVEWLYDGWFKLSRGEYAIMVSILVVIMAVGVLPAVGLGLILAITLFVVNYSRISVVRHTLSGASYRSNVDRPSQQRQILKSSGPLIYILELQGFIFFGTANNLLEQVRRRLNDPDQPVPRFVVLDFRQVAGLDASAVLSFSRMKQLAQAQGLALVLTNLPDSVRSRLASELCTSEDQTLCHIDLDLDHGVEWCEEQILALSATEPGEQQIDGPSSLTAITESETWEHQVSAGPISIGSSGIKEFMQRLEAAKGEPLIQQGDAPHGLYFLEAGQVTALRECADGSLVRLRKMGPGSIVGEMGLYLGIPASASVVTAQPSTVYYLSAAELERMEKTRPEMAAAFHRYVAQLIGERLARANDTLQALLE